MSDYDKPFDQIEHDHLANDSMGPMQVADNDLRGFWRGENAMPSGVRQIAGDPKQFERDLAKCRERTHKRLDRMQGNKFLLMVTWPEELLYVDIWTENSIGYNKQEDSE